MCNRLIAMLLLVASACAAPATEMVACPARGCASLDPPTPIDAALLEHAERDLECPRAELYIEACGAASSRVSGCGRAARYAWIARTRWILDSPIMAARH
jgi:hypothetical protein